MTPSWRCHRRRVTESQKSCNSGCPQFAATSAAASNSEVEAEPSSRASPGSAESISRPRPATATAADGRRRAYCGHYRRGSLTVQTTRLDMRRRQVWAGSSTRTTRDVTCTGAIFGRGTAPGRGSNCVSAAITTPIEPRQLGVALPDSEAPPADAAIPRSRLLGMPLSWECFGVPPLRQVLAVERSPWRRLRSQRGRHSSAERH
jgi:hypothetical protein